MKLSELLHAATFYLSRAAKRFENESWDDPAADALSDKAVALHAIAPALVELVAADRAASLMENGSGRRLLFAQLTLRAALEKAGVTCE